jgi:hypothetical protein
MAGPGSSKTSIVEAPTELSKKPSGFEMVVGGGLLQPGGLPYWKLHPLAWVRT